MALPRKGSERAKGKRPPPRHTQGIRMLLKLLRQAITAPAPNAPSTPAAPSLGPGLSQPASASTLLTTARRRKLLDHIWERTSLSRAQFAKLYLAPIERYAELVQLFPASEAHHHAYPGGMLDHGLEVVAYALKIRQTHLLPKGAPPEAQAAQAEMWTAGAAYGALLHDIGKIAIDLHVEHADASVWHPWNGPLRQAYRFRYRKDREYRLHNAATGLLYVQVLDRHILDWLSGNRELWSSLLYVLAGQMEHAGILGELVSQADQASVAQNMGGDPTKALTAPKHALQRKLLDGLRHLIREEFKLNQPQASDGWLTQDALWLVSKTVSDKLRAHLLTQGIEGIPANNSAVFNVLQEHAIAQPTPDGKAIWKATVTSDSAWSHTFTFLKLSPALIWEGDSRPAPFNGSVQAIQDDSDVPISSSPMLASASPQELGAAKCSAGHAPVVQATTGDSVTSPDDLDSLLDLLAPTSLAPSAPVMQDEAPNTYTPPSAAQVTALLASSEPATTTVGGVHFVAWLKQGIASKRIIINDTSALVHTVNDTVFLVTPGIFRRYAQEHLQIAMLAKTSDMADWQWAQKQFARLSLHRKQGNGLNIWTCNVVGPRKSKWLHGYLLSDPSLIFGEGTPPNNPFLKERP
jgi:integrating conjugative element relaxase (TIGR03760 family)